MNRVHKLWLASALVATFACAASAQPAGTPGMNCSQGKYATAKECELKFDTELSSRDEMLALVRDRQFRRLEQSLRSISQSTALFPSRRYKNSMVAWLLLDVATAEKKATDPSGTTTLAAWKAAVPDSQFVPLIEAAMLYAEAWDVRGNGYASTVSPESWKIFRSKLEQAQAMLLDAPPEVKAYAAWHSLRLRVALDLDSNPANWLKIYANAVDSWPLYIGNSERVVYKLTPKWGGSWQLLDSFANEAAKRVASTEKTSYYARLYSYVGDEVVDGGVQLDWPKLKQSFEDWSELVPDAATRVRYAAFACYARDKKTYRAVVAKIPGDQLSSGEWLPGYSHDVCELWASR
jgi:hypothetical protein